jgi:hypothetical protein
MHTYEKPPTSRNRGPNYSGLIAVICLVASMLTAWALTKTSLHANSASSVTTAMAPSADR